MALGNTYPAGDDAEMQVRRTAFERIEGQAAIRNKQLDIYCDGQPESPLFSVHGPNERVRVEGGAIVSTEFELPPIEPGDEDREVPYVLAFWTGESHVFVFYDNETGVISSDMLDYSLWSKDQWVAGTDPLSGEPIMGEHETQAIMGMLHSLHEGVKAGVDQVKAPGVNLHLMQTDYVGDYCEGVSERLESAIDVLEDPDYEFEPVSEETEHTFAQVVRELLLHAPSITTIRTRTIAEFEILPTHAVTFTQYEDGQTKDIMIIDRTSTEEDPESDQFGRHDCLVLDAEYVPKLFKIQSPALGEQRIKDATNLRQTVLRFAGILAPEDSEVEQARQQALTRLHQEFCDNQFFFSNLGLFKSMAFESLQGDEYDAKNKDILDVTRGWLH